MLTRRMKSLVVGSIVLAVVMSAPVLAGEYVATVSFSQGETENEPDDFTPSVSGSGEVTLNSYTTGKSESGSGAAGSCTIDIEADASYATGIAVGSLDNTITITWEWDPNDPESDPPPTGGYTIVASMDTSEMTSKANSADSDYSDGDYDGTGGSGTSYAYCSEYNGGAVAETELCVHDMQISSLDADASSTDSGESFWKWKEPVEEDIVNEASKTVVVWAEQELNGSVTGTTFYVTDQGGESFSISASCGVVAIASHGSTDGTGGYSGGQGVVSMSLGAVLIEE